ARVHGAKDGDERVALVRRGLRHGGEDRARAARPRALDRGDEVAVIERREPRRAKTLAEADHRVRALARRERGERRVRGEGSGMEAIDRIGDRGGEEGRGGVAEIVRVDARGRPWHVHGEAAAVGGAAHAEGEAGAERKRAEARAELREELSAWGL